MVSTAMTDVARLHLRGRRPCLRRDIDFVRGRSSLDIDAAELGWASPMDLTAIASVASWSAPDGVSLTLPNSIDVAQYLARMNLVPIVRDLGGMVTGPRTLTEA